MNAPQNNPVAALLPAIALSPALYPQKLDLEKRQVRLLRMMEADYRHASFLDDRVLNPRADSAWVDLNTIDQAMAGAHAAKPLHYIFHAGHVGSTLLSRLLDETDLVLPLREPLPLRTFADLFDRDRAEIDLETFLRLWSRGFAATRAVVLKATSNTARLGPHLLGARPASRAVCLNLAAEPYLATLLAGEHAVIDLNNHAAERSARLERMLGEKPPTASLGELAAMSWLAERLTQSELVSGFGGRVIALDFEEMLAQPGETVRRVTGHFGLSVPPAFFLGIERSPVLQRYSKAPEYRYSRALRAQILGEARARHAPEIRRGRDWLGRLAARHERLAGLLD